MNKLVLFMSAALLMTSCVPKKKYVALEKKYNTTKLEKEQLEQKFAKIEKRVENYNNKISSLRDINSNLKKENDNKLDITGNTVISSSMKKKMRETLKNVDAAELSKAKTLQDSMSLAVSYSLKKSIDTSDLENSDDVAVNIDNTVVMISVSDKMLFNTASYRVNKKAHKILKKLADIIKSEPSMEVMIEGHTDSRLIRNEVLVDNWDLSVKRATSIVRVLEKKYGIESNRLIAAGRGSSVPLVDNNTSKNRARNRRTKIMILPNLDKFFGLMAREEVLEP